MKHSSTSSNNRGLIELAFLMSFLIGMLLPFPDTNPTKAGKRMAQTHPSSDDVEIFRAGSYVPAGPTKGGTARQRSDGKLGDRGPVVPRETRRPR